MMEKFEILLAFPVNFSAFSAKVCPRLGSAPTTYIGCRVGSDFPKASTWSVGSVGSGRVIWSVGCRDFSGSTLPKKMIKIADKIRKRYFFGLSFLWSRLCEHFSFSDDSLLFFSYLKLQIFD